MRLVSWLALIFLISAAFPVAGQMDGNNKSHLLEYSNDRSLLGTDPHAEACILDPILCASLMDFNDDANWFLHSPLEYKILNTSYRIVVPAGFVTDFASIPWPLWSFMPRTGTYKRAAIVHDYLYWTHACSREQADILLRLAMFESGVSDTTSWLIFKGVREGGQDAWDTNFKERAEGLPRFVPPEAFAPLIAPQLTIGSLDTWPDYRARLQRQRTALDPLFSSPPPYCAVAQQLWDEREKRIPQGE